MAPLQALSSAMLADSSPVSHLQMKTSVRKRLAGLTSAFTTQTQVTYLDEFLFPQFIFVEFGPRPGNLAGRTTDPGASNEGWYKWKGNSSLEWTWKGFDLVTIVRFIDGFNEFTPNLHQHWVHQTWTFGGLLSYDFTYLLPVEEQPVPGYSKSPKDFVRGKDGAPLEKAVE